MSKRRLEMAIQANRTSQSWPRSFLRKATTPLVEGQFERKVRGCPRIARQEVAQAQETRRRLRPAVVHPEVTAEQIRLRVYRVLFGPKTRRCSPGGFALPANVKVAPYIWLLVSPEVHTQFGGDDWGQAGGNATRPALMAAATASGSYNIYYGQVPIADANYADDVYSSPSGANYTPLN